MNEEIKEILDNIKNKYEEYYVQDIVSGNDLKCLLDYITNLQEELRYQKEMELEFNEKHTKLMNKCKRIRYYLEEPNRDNFDFSKAYILSILDGDDNCFNDYKSRIDKAIEYIKSNICDIDFMKKEYGKHLIDFDVDTTFNDIEKLLNILQGEDNK